jgi:hypothetical protein
LRLALLIALSFFLSFFSFFLVFLLSFFAITARSAKDKLDDFIVYRGNIRRHGRFTTRAAVKSSL